MNTDPNTLVNTVNWFKEAKPEPKEIDLQVQLGVHFEEVKEMVEQITGEDRQAVILLIDAFAALRDLSEYLKNAPNVVIGLKDPIKYLDSIGDQIVTATGSGVFAGMDVVGGLNEINRSNYSKFVDGKPIYKPNGKIDKGPDYTEPDLTPFI